LKQSIVLAVKSIYRLVSEATYMSSGKINSTL